MDDELDSVTSKKYDPRNLQIREPSKKRGSSLLAPLTAREPTAKMLEL